MKAVFLITFRQFIRGGARTWFTWVCAVICTGLLGAVLFGGESLAAAFAQRFDLSQMVLVLSQMVLVLLIAGLALMHRSVFRLSLSQRTRMLGQLASLGETQRQLRQSVWLEAVILAVCSIPIGLTAAAAGLAMVFSFLSNSKSMDARPLSLLIRPQHVLMAAGCVLITLLLAAWGTARRAARMTAIEAVRETHVLPKLHGEKGFRNVEKLLAVRSSSVYHYNASQTAVITVCVFLVLMTLGFSDGMVRAYQSSIPDYAYRIYIWVRSGEQPAELDRVVREAVTHVNGSRVYSSEDTGLLWPVGNVAAKILTLDDAAFQKWYGAPLPDSDQSVLNCIYSVDKEQPFLFLAGDQSPDGSCKVVDVCNTPLPAGLREKNGFTNHYLVTPQSAYETLSGKVQRSERLLQILVETEDATQLTLAIVKALEGMAVQDNSFSLLGSDTTAYTIQDFTETSQSYTMILAATGLLRICGGGFVVLLAIGCSASVLSAASAQAQMRRREFALLRSAGMTRKSQRYMLGIEARRRCLWGLALGVPAGIAAFFFLEKQLVPFYDFYWMQCLIDALKAGLIVAMCTMLVCWTAHRVALAAARGANIRDDLTWE